MQKTRLIEAGFVVVGDVEVTGCASYKITGKTEKSKDNKVDADWHTEKHVANLTEQNAVRNKRHELVTRMRGLGAHIAGFGYIVPLVNASKLEATMASIEKEAGEYNQQAKNTRVSVGFAVLEVASNDERVALALYKRATELLGTVNDAINAGDIKKLRQQLRRLRGLDEVLPPTTGAKIADAIAGARAAAKAAVEATKDIDEKKAVATIKKILSTAPVNGLRAEMVETTNKLQKSKKRLKLSPVNARQIEG